MSHVLSRTLKESLPVAVAGDGPYIVDRDGKRYLDASGGAAISCLGHSHPAVVDAIHRQAAMLAFSHTAFFTTEAAELLADSLIAQAPSGLTHAVFVSGGSEAVEIALKLVRQYFSERNEPNRRYIIARRQSYHGSTLGALAVSGHQRRRAHFAPWLFPCVEHIAPCYPYRYQRPDETLDAYGCRCAEELEASILRLGPENVAAFIAETVGGATSGCLVPPAGYLQQVQAICRRYGIVYIADEIMCGLGRTGSMYACEQEEVAPDIITLAKGLAAGYQAIGAVLVSSTIVDAIRSGSGVHASGHSFMGHPVACAAALAVQDVIRSENLLSNVRTMGTLLRARLEEQFGEHPYVGDIRGRGLFLALELVVDRATKRPFPVSASLASTLRREMQNQGLLCYASSGTVDGYAGDHLLFAPPFNVEPCHIDELIEKAARVMDTSLLKAALHQSQSGDEAGSRRDAHD